MTMLSLTVALARGIHLVGTLSLFGTLLFAIAIVPTALAASGPEAVVLRTRITGLARASFVLAIVDAAIWLMLQTVVMTGGGSDALHALLPILLHTHFGVMLLLRIALLSAAMFAGGFERGRAVGAGLAGLACALQGEMGHAAAMSTSQLAFVGVHVIAAGAWLGGLAPFWITLRILEPNDAVIVARRFSPLGILCVTALTATAILQENDFVGGLPGLFGTDYGALTLAKLGLFGMLLACAACNRFVLTPALGAIDPLRAKRRIRIVVVVEVALGILVVLTASALATTMPGAHQQPDWPFAFRPSLAAVVFPFQRRELVDAGLVWGAVASLAVVGVVLRRLRWPALIAAATIALLAPRPPLGLLVVEAYRTSFYQSTAGFTARSIAHGAEVFAANCAACHGPDGRGLGPFSGAQFSPPDLTGSGLWAHSDGDLYWFLTDGIELPNHRLAMPGFADRLSEEDRWDVIDFLHANADGADAAANGDWVPAVAAPALQADCGDGRILQLADFAGRPVRILAEAPTTDARKAKANGGIPTIVIARTAGDRRLDTCVDSSPTTWTGYAVVAGVSPEALTGSQFLVDGDGWLRALWRPGDTPGWTASLADKLREIETHPIVKGGESHHHAH